MPSSSERDVPWLAALGGVAAEAMPLVIVAHRHGDGRREVFGPYGDGIEVSVAAEALRAELRREFPDRTYTVSVARLLPGPSP